MSGAGVVNMHTIQNADDPMIDDSVNGCGRELPSNGTPHHCRPILRVTLRLVLIPHFPLALWKS